MSNRFLALAASLTLLASLHAEAGLQAFAGVVGGKGSADIAAGCTTFGAPLELSPFYGSAPLKMRVAGGNAACGYAGGWSLLTQPAAPAGAVLANSSSLAPVLLGNPGFAGTYDGEAAARARYGALGARASGDYKSGLPGSPVALSYAMAAAQFGDQLTATSPLIANLSAGFVQYRIHLEGRAEALGAQAPFFSGEARAQLFLQHQGGPVFMQPYVGARRGSLGGWSSGDPLPPTWAAGPGFIDGGSDFLSITLPMVWGQPWDFELGLLVWAEGESAADFSNTATLTAVQLFDATGQPVSDFRLVTGSGAVYANAVPEPSVALLFLVGLAALGTRCRQRRA
jgi:PEP-CTERM motif